MDACRQDGELAERVLPYGEGMALYRLRMRAARETPEAPANTDSTREEASRTSLIRSMRYSRAAPHLLDFRGGKTFQICVGRPQVGTGKPQDVADLRKSVVERLQVLDEGEANDLRGRYSRKPPSVRRWGAMSPFSSQNLIVRTLTPHFSASSPMVRNSLRET